MAVASAKRESERPGKKRRAPRNRTIVLTENEKKRYAPKLLRLSAPVTIDDVVNKIINQDFYDAAPFLPPQFADLVFVDPPYNLTKDFNDRTFKKRSVEEYSAWMESWLKVVAGLMKPAATIYVCGDWRSSAAAQSLCEKYFKVRNRITFEREKGRGAKRGWKNNAEDIWFCTLSDKYYFNPEAVKQRRRVVAPYREGGEPKDWREDGAGGYRLTYPSNIWTDVTIPFWSMRENTPHPTQKPEKLLAKIILASSREGDVIFDPFAGVGTTAVVAKKLKRRFVAVEIDREYCLYAQKRLASAAAGGEIQGYRDGVFWDRNAGHAARKRRGLSGKAARKTLSRDLTRRASTHRRPA
jgi:site-specific DNA-methyltransferase (adenine-specific)